MVKAKQDKRRRDIKSKLMAAICMLLVSSIMMVSSTYAWFTLSTAPEVTGITTAVGANGNLEMALLPTSGATADITTNVGDSGKDDVDRNITWGNLVNLSDDDVYGMGDIVLNPAELNIADGAIKAAPLKIPAYGSDGRISEMVENTVTGVYSEGAFYLNDSAYGVRAVGTANGMTDRQLAYRNTRSAANTAMAQAKNTAASSLNTNGNALANIAIKHGTDKGATHDQTEVAALMAIVDDLLGTDTKTGALEYIEQAYINYIIAYGASQDGVHAGMDDTEFNAFQNLVKDAEDLDKVIAELAAYNVNLPSELTDAIAELEATKTEVATAQTELKDLQSAGSETIEWGNISTPLYRLANTDAMTINGIAAGDITSNIDALVQSYTDRGGLTLEMVSGGGVYADIADHCGDYESSIVIEQIEWGSLKVTNVTARMATASDQNTPYLVLAGTAVTTAGSPAADDTQEKPITDMYGYIIDLAFRTNAAESKLLLQTEALNRIYSEGGSEETMGNGSSMTFKATTVDFSDLQVKNLMKCIRLVFYVPAADATGQNTVLAYGKLNVYGTDDTTDLTTTTADGITANIVLYTNVEGTTTTYEETTDGATHVADSSVDGGYREATADETATHKAVVTGTGTYTETILAEDEAVITALTQNDPQKVSVLVYLDGASITNADVAATASTSVTGTMNLQFSSSANLVPMDYIDYMAQGTTGSDEQTNTDSGEQTGTT